MSQDFAIQLLVALVAVALILLASIARKLRSVHADVLRRDARNASPSREPDEEEEEEDEEEATRTCAALTADGTRCIAAVDPRCGGTNCTVHCNQLCNGRCVAPPPPPPSHPLDEEEEEGEEEDEPRLCAFVDDDGSCKATADPRCGGLNCTRHCGEYCGGRCMRADPIREHAIQDLLTICRAHLDRGFSITEKLRGVFTVLDALDAAKARMTQLRGDERSCVAPASSFTPAMPVTPSAPSDAPSGDAPPIGGAS